MSDIIEPVVISEDFVTEIGRIEEMAPNLYRVTICARQRCDYDRERYESVIKAKLFMTGEAMQEMSLALAAGAEGARPEFAALSPSAAVN